MMMYERASSLRLKSMNYLADVKMVPFSAENQVSGTKSVPLYRDTFDLVQKLIGNTKRRAPKPENGEKAFLPIFFIALTVIKSSGIM